MRNLLFAVLVSAACATAHPPNSGLLEIKPIGAMGGPPATFSVGPGHVSGRIVDAYVDKGCLYGTMGQLPLALCDDGKGHWTGVSGDVTLKPTPDGKAVDVGGYLQLDNQRTFQLDGERLPFEQGPQWDEMRRNPILLVISTAATDLAGGHLLRRPGY